MKDMGLKIFELLSKLSMTNALAGLIDPQKEKHDLGVNLVEGHFDDLKFPIRFQQLGGKNFNDILDTGYPNLYLISDRFRSILEEYKLTGWTTYPIDLVGKSGKNLSGYSGFSVLGNCTPIDYSKSPIVEKRRVEHGPICRFYRGVTVEGWDGTDFFRPRGTLSIYVTQRAAKILKSHKVTNLRLQDLDTIETSCISISNE